MFDIIVHFIIQKLKNKPTFLKKYTNEKAKFSHFDRTRGDKNQIFLTEANSYECNLCQQVFLRVKDLFKHRERNRCKAGLDPSTTTLV